MDPGPLVTLDGFVDIVESVRGVNVRSLEPLTRVIVKTCNSEYRLIVSSDGGVLVQGGRFFERPTEAVLEGATLNGGLLKIGWIAIGMRMEIRDDSRRIVTSPVCQIATDEGFSPGVH
jgi:energy-converting hydrogenase Eha subunit F